MKKKSTKKTKKTKIRENNVQDKSIMEMADEILASDFKEVADTTSAYQEQDLPSISDEQRDAMLNESMAVSESDVPVQPGARRQHTLQGLSKNTLGTKKPKKTMGTPPGFKKTPEEEAAAAKKPGNASESFAAPTNRSATQTHGDREDIENARRKRDGLPPKKLAVRSSDPRATFSNPNPAPQKRDKRGMVIKDKPQGRAENASLYPRITIKAESRERTKRGNAIRADAARRRQRDGTGSTEASRAQGAADFAEREAKRKADRSASMAAANQATRDADAKRKAGQTLDPRTGKPRTDGGPTAQNSSITRKQHAVLREALEILQEATSSGGVGTSMAGSANKCYDADAKPMGKDNVPIADADKSLKKVKKGDKKKAKKKAAKKEEAKMESFDTFLDKVLNDAKEGF